MSLPGLAADQGCPKHMVMGPCGGVQPDGGCEVRAQPCAFPAPVAWSDPVRPVPLDTVPLILTDFSSQPYTVSAHAAVAGILAPVSDAVLVGEHQHRPDFPPARRSATAGSTTWSPTRCGSSAITSTGTGSGRSRRISTPRRRGQGSRA